VTRKVSSSIGYDMTCSHITCPHHHGQDSQIRAVLDDIIMEWSVHICTARPAFQHIFFLQCNFLYVHSESKACTLMQTCKQPTDDAVMVHKLELTDVSPESVNLMLDFLYGDFKASLTFAEAAALFRTSHKYDVTELQQQCERALVALMSQHTIYELENLAIQYHSPRLAQVRHPAHTFPPACSSSCVSAECLSICDR